MLRYGIAAVLALGLLGIAAAQAKADDKKPTMGEWVCYVPSGVSSSIGGRSGAIYYEAKHYPKNRYQILVNETGLTTIIDTQIDRVVVARYINVQCVEQY